MECSMSRKGNCWDNAVVESFFSTLKQELVYTTDRVTHEQVRLALRGHRGLLQPEEAALDPGLCQPRGVRACGLTAEVGGMTQLSM
jgi:transposase InsO family protein